MGYNSYRIQTECSSVVHTVLLLEKADIMQLRETLKLKYQIKISEIEIQEQVGSGENTISTHYQPFYLFFLYL